MCQILTENHRQSRIWSKTISRLHMQFWYTFHFFGNYFAKHFCWTILWSNAPLSYITCPSLCLMLSSLFHPYFLERINLQKEIGFSHHVPWLYFPEVDKQHCRYFKHASAIFYEGCQKKIQTFHSLNPYQTQNLNYSNYEKNENKIFPDVILLSFPINLRLGPYFV